MQTIYWTLILCAHSEGPSLYDYGQDYGPKVTKKVFFDHVLIYMPIKKI